MQKAIYAVFWGCLLCAALPARADYQAAADFSAETRGVTMLVIQGGEIIFEEFANGGGAQRGYPLASGTKSFSGILAAVAVQDGLLNLDEPVADTIHEWRGDARAAITIRHLLQLTDGLSRPERAHHRISYEEAIARPAAHSPGQVYDYSPVPFQVFGEVMRRKLGGDPVDYLMARVLDPIGIDVARWRRRGGNPTMAAGASLTTRDWARFGEFILAHGEWDGQQLVDPVTFDALFVGSQANPAYGLTWWLNEAVSPQLARSTPPLRRASDFWRNRDVFPSDMVFAAGAGNQRLYISWEEDLIVVRQGEGVLRSLMGDNSGWSDVEFWRLLRE